MLCKLSKCCEKSCVISQYKLYLSCRIDELDLILSIIVFDYKTYLKKITLLCINLNKVNLRYKTLN